MLEPSSYDGTSGQQPLLGEPESKSKKERAHEEQAGPKAIGQSGRVPQTGCGDGGAGAGRNLGASPAPPSFSCLH